MSHHNLFGIPADTLGLVVESISWWKDICRLRTTCRRARRGAIGRFVPQYHAARRAAWNQPFHRCGLHEVNITNEVKDTSIGERRRSFIEVLIDPSGARDERPLAPPNTCLDLSICTMLQVLRLSYTNLWHVLSLPRYTNLRVLDLSYTACGFRIDAQTNLCGLSECSNLVTLDLTHFGRGGLHRGPIYAQMPYLDLRPLSKCTRLQTLMLYHARVNDISPLCWCTQLCFIDLSYTTVTSLESLQDCHDLRCVMLEGMEHTVQWYFNAAMTSLRELYFEHSIVVDLTLISLCVHIETIDLRECIILNIQGLKNCRTLKCLYLDGSTVTDISILATCTSLQILSLAKTRVSDIEALRSCKQLKSIDLYGTMVKDVSALLSCPNLYYTGMRRDLYQTNVELILGIVDANGQRHSVNHSMDIGSVTTAEQIIAVARDPYRVAEWYDMMLQAVTDELLVPEGVYDDECDPASGAPARLARGIMGTLVAFFGVNENAQRMALHSHLKLWLAEMRFVQRATQANDITLRHLERVMARFVESLTSALLLGHSDDGIDRFDGEENDKQADVMKAVDLHELSFCDEEGFNVADVRPMGAPSPAEFFRHISPTGAHAVTPSRDVAATEAAFGPAWFERVSKAAVARANRMVQRPGEEAITAATLRRKYVSPVYTGSSRNRNDVDSSHKGSSSTTSGKGAPGAPAIPDGESAAWRGRALRGKIRIRALGVTGPGNIDEFELECATACSRIETQALMHGTRRRTTTPIVPSSGGGPVMSGGIDKVARECTPCCHKTREAKRRGTCRLRFGPDGRAIIDFTYFDDDGIIHLARNHGHLVPNSKTATLTLRVNNSMELAFYGRDSLALSLYVTSYIGKGDLDLYELSLLLVSASEKTDLICPSNAGAGVPGTPGSRGGGGKGLSTTAVAAVRMLNGVSGGVQVGGVMNATVHGGMKLETQSHALFYMKTTPFIMAARSFGPVEGDDACELDGGAIEDSQALEQAVTGDCFSTTLYDDYVNRVNADQKNSIYEEERDTVREIGLLSAFEWCRAWYARTPCAKRGKWKPTSRRLPDGQYAATYNPVSGSFCQTRITKLRVLNYQGIQMPGKDGCAESLARWIVMLHVPYENRIALEGLYNDGVEQDADHPWEAALNCWFDTLDAACEPGTGESTVSVKVVRRSDSLQWVDAGSGWTRLILPSKDVSGGVFFPPCPCPMCAVECPIACLLRGGLKVGGSGVPFCGESDGEDTDDGALYEHLRGCVICKRVNRNCPYGSRRGWTNRYIRYCRDMFDGSDAATRLKVEERRAKAVDVLEHISCAGGHDGADKPYSCDGDLPPGVSEADRDLLERFLVDAGTQDEVLAPPLTRAAAQFGTRLSAFRAGVCLDEADRFQRSTLMTLLGRGSEEPASLVRFRVAIRSVAGPFGEHPISRLPVCSDLRAAQSLLFSGRTTDDASDVEQGVPAVTFPTADALRSGNRVMAAAAADVAMGVSPVGSTLEVSGALTFANAVLEYRLTALQTIQFMLVVACYEVELGGLVDRVFHRRSSRLERVEVFDEATSTTRPEFSEGELRELTRMVTIGFADTEGGFQLGMLVTGTGGTGTYRGRVPVGWLFADAGSN